MAARHGPQTPAGRDMVLEPFYCRLQRLLAWQGMWPSNLTAAAMRLQARRLRTARARCRHRTYIHIARHADQLDCADMTPEQQKMIDAGQAIAGAFPRGLTKAELSAWIAAKLLP